MQTIQAPKMIEILLAPIKRPVLRLILTDEGIIRRLLETSLIALKQGTPSVLVGKGASAEFVDVAASGSLFALPPPAIVELDPKLTQKQWEAELKILARLPRPPESCGFFIGPTSLRHVLKNDAIFQESFLCWSPNDADAFRAAQVLVRRHPAFAKTPAAEVDALVGKTLEYYSNDLLMCDMHFERMAQSSLDFDAALSGQTEARAGQVVEALAQGSGALVELRMQQCLLSGEPIALILKSVSGFLRQLSQVQSLLERSSDVDGALRTLEIWQPLLQARLRKALKVLPPERVAAFFFASPEMEMATRTQKNPHAWLSVELMALLKPDG